MDCSLLVGDGCSHLRSLDRQTDKQTDKQTDEKAFFMDGVMDSPKLHFPSGIARNLLWKESTDPKNSLLCWRQRRRKETERGGQNGWMEIGTGIVVWDTNSSEY